VRHANHIDRLQVLRVERAAKRLRFVANGVARRQRAIVETVLDRNTLEIDHAAVLGEQRWNAAPAVGAEQPSTEQDDWRAVAFDSGRQGSTAGRRSVRSRQAAGARSGTPPAIRLKLYSGDAVSYEGSDRSCMEA
jgi:hypothetical protein